MAAHVSGMSAEDIKMRVNSAVEKIVSLEKDNGNLSRDMIKVYNVYFDRTLNKALRFVANYIPKPLSTQISSQISLYTQQLRSKYKGRSMEEIHKVVEEKLFQILREKNYHVPYQNFVKKLNDNVVRMTYHRCNNQQRAVFDTLKVKYPKIFANVVHLYARHLYTPVYRRAVQQQMMQRNKLQQAKQAGSTNAAPTTSASAATAVEKKNPETQQTSASTALPAVETEKKSSLSSSQMRSKKSSAGPAKDKKEYLAEIQVHADGIRSAQVDVHQEREKSMRRARSFMPRAVRPKSTPIGSSPELAQFVDRVARKHGVTKVEEGVYQNMWHAISYFLCDIVDDLCLAAIQRCQHPETFPVEPSPSLALAPSLETTEPHRTLPPVPSIRKTEVKKWEAELKAMDAKSERTDAERNQVRWLRKRIREKEERSRASKGLEHESSLQYTYRDLLETIRKQPRLANSPSVVKCMAEWRDDNFDQYCV